LTAGILAYVTYRVPAEPTVIDGRLAVDAQPHEIIWRRVRPTDDLIGEDVVRTVIGRDGVENEYGLVAVSDVYPMLAPDGPWLVVRVLPRGAYYVALETHQPMPSGQPVIVNDVWVRADCPQRAG
jgi:hypothetical protein